MNVVVLLKMVPDVVEELEIAADGKSLDNDVVRMILSEWCDHALEQALLLKERYGGSVTVVALEAPEVDDALYAALAKGADRAFKVTGEFVGCHSIRQAAGFTYLINQVKPALSPMDVILTGSQAIDDLEGEVGAYVAERLQIPYIGVITGVMPHSGGGKLAVRKEFAGGLRGEFEITLPAVVGIQSSEKAPRYVPIAKIREAMKSGRIEEIHAEMEVTDRLTVDGLLKPTPTARAEMIEGSPAEIAAKLADILVEQGLL